MRINLFSKTFIFFGIIGFLLISCNSKSGEKQQTSTVSPEIEAKLAAQDTIFIALEGNDQMQFNKNEIVVYDGQTVVLTLTHVGTMPKTSMGHNFVLIDQGISPSSYAKQAIKAKSNDYIPEDSQLTLAHTKMIGGGESTEITFDAPEKGDYDFLCSFPGHYAIMKGKFIVK